MRQAIFFVILSLSLLIGLKSFSQKTEIRAVWIATVSNLDWPNVASLNDADAQKSSMLIMLDSIVSWNLNAIFFQIRPKSDAFYQSELVPWSQYLTGTRGTNPRYDPLLFVIEEAHKRGIEVHGWLNPYRFESYFNEHGDSPNGVYSANPELLLTYKDEDDAIRMRILNPGEPKVIRHLKEVVGEIINNYNVDGIHFDDYFYPYSGTTNEDSATFATYGEGFENIADWRRNNITSMVQAVSDTIRSIKPFLRFGISPFGIYGNGQNPSGIIGLDAYNQIFTDPIAWLQNGSIDYVCPQLYWPTGGGQDFEALLKWWADKAALSNRHVIAGQGIYRLSDNVPALTARVSSARSPDNNPIKNLHERKSYLHYRPQRRTMQRRTSVPNPWTLGEIVNQIKIVRNASDKNAVGSSFFRYQDFIRVNGLADYLKSNVYGFPSILPAMTWKSISQPVSPNLYSWKINADGIAVLEWKRTNPDDRYVVYSSGDAINNPEFFNDPSNIKKVVFENHLTLNETEGTPKPYFYINSYDRYGRESETPLEVLMSPPDEEITLSLPADGAVDLSASFNFTWKAVSRVQLYEIQISREPDFSAIDFEKQVSSISFNAKSFKLKGSQKYFWRVIPLNVGGRGPVSAVSAFSTGFPSVVSVVSPANEAKDVSLSPLFRFEFGDLTEQLSFQIAKGLGLFEQANIIHDVTFEASKSYQLPIQLEEFTDYKIRVEASNSLGKGDPAYSSFRTLKKPPGSTVIISPVDGGFQETEEDLEVKWTLIPNASGYQLSISEDAERQIVLAKGRTLSRIDTSFIFKNIPSGTYYINVSGTNLGGNGKWSQIIYSIKEPTILGSEDVADLKILQNRNGDLLIYNLKFNTPLPITLYGTEGKIYLTRIINDEEIDPIKLKNPQLKGITILHLGFKNNPKTYKFFIE